MGTTGCKPTRSSGARCNSDCGDEPEPVESISIGMGVRVHQLEGNNYLGRLQDAGRMRYRGRGLWRRQNSNTANAKAAVAAAAAASGGGPRGSGGCASSSARSSCYSELSSGFWQQQQQQQKQQQYLVGAASQQQQPQPQPQQPELQTPQRQMRRNFISTAPAHAVATGTGAGPGGGGGGTLSLDIGGQLENHGGSDEDSSSPAEHRLDASRMNLTTLLLQGFDPVAYEQRVAERRLAKLTGGSKRAVARSVATSATYSTTCLPGTVTAGANDAAATTTTNATNNGSVPRRTERRQLFIGRNSSSSNRTAIAVRA